MYLGIALVALAGAMSGSGVWPLKAVKVFNFDQIYFFAPLFSFLIIPWTVAFIFCPDIMDIVARIPRERMVFFSVMAVFYTVGCYMGWYTAARLGVGIAYGINSCFANITGVMIPILFKGTGQFADSPDFLTLPSNLVMLSVAGMCTAIMLIQNASMVKSACEKDETISRGRRNFYVFCGFLNGLLGNFATFVLVYGGSEVIELLTRSGQTPFIANIIVWGIVFPMVPVTAMLITGARMTVHREWKKIIQAPAEILYVFLAGIQTSVCLGVYATGVIFLGSFGGSVGAGFSTSFQIIASQLLGVFSGEWKNAGPKARRTMIIALVIVFVSIILLSAGNYLAGG
ncbi:MAG: hypothetical protein ILO36_08175 [Abditibacteriota bacterium]|nr:hypothetical protein [Abditibacteriota bacterium]